MLFPPCQSCLEDLSYIRSVFLSPACACAAGLAAGPIFVFVPASIRDFCGNGRLRLFQLDSFEAQTALHREIVRMWLDGSECLQPTSGKNEEFQRFASGPVRVHRETQVRPSRWVSYQKMAAAISSSASGRTINGGVIFGLVFQEDEHERLSRVDHVPSARLPQQNAALTPESKL
jgi:hypothetical protein